MEQRPLRLGDLVDDYCPRERRVTDHAVVAMIDDTIKQTRCTACDSEHQYKGGKAPRRKKAPTTSRLYKEVLAGIKDADTSEEPDTDVPALADAVSADVPVAGEDTSSVAVVEASASESSVDDPALDEAPPDEPPPDEPLSPVDEGPVHRPLIRATLPRPDGMKVERPIPEFTIRNNGNGRPHGNGSFRDARGGGGAGKARGAGQQRFNRGPGGARQGRGSGSGPGFGGGRPGGGGGSRRRGR